MSANPVADLIDQFPEIVASCDGDGRTIYLNRAGRRFWALEEGEAVGLPSCDHWYPDSVARMIRDVALPAAARDGRWEGDVTLLDGSGGERRFIQVISPVRSGDGSPAGFSTVMREGLAPRPKPSGEPDPDKLFPHLFRFSPYVAILTELETRRILDVSDRLCAFLGETRESLINGINDHETWVDAAECERIYEELRRNGVVYDRIVRFYNHAREVRVGHFSGGIIEFRGRRCVHAVFEDFTELARTEEALRGSEERFSKAFYASPDPYIISDARSHAMIEVNDAYCRLFGVTREEAVGRRNSDLGLWANLAHRDRFLELLARDGEVSEMEQHRRNRAGDTVICLAAAFGMEINGRACLLYRLRDITRERQVEQALRESEEKFSRVFHASPDSVAISTLAEGRIIEITDGFTRLHGWTREEALGRTVDQLALWDDPTERDLLHSRLREGRPVHNVRVVARDRNGGRHHCLFSAVTIEIAGEPCRLSVVRDVTEQQRMEEQLRQAQKMESIGQLAGGVAHDFNNILTVIQGHTSFLLEDRSLAPSVRSSLLQVRQSATLAADLTRQLLVFARRQAIQPGPVRMVEVVDRVVRLLDRVIGENIVLDVLLPPDLPPVNADAAMMEQVLLNLAVNARDAMPGGGRIAITGRTVLADEAYVRRMPQARRGRFAGMCVSDTGEGIVPEVLPRIFDPFFTTKQQGKGTGLGLATVYSIIQQHGGWIDVESERGRGTTFTAWFPVADAAPAAAPKPPPLLPAAAPGHETILVVEDKSDVRAVLQAVLRRLGYQVLMADDGADALRRWSEHRDEIALLFTDVMMPGGLTGKDLAEKLRVERPGLKVVYCTGYDANILDAATLKAEGTGFLTKPFDVASLAAVVRDLLDTE